MKASLREEFVQAAAGEIRRSGIDGWLLYDMKARNPVAADLLGLPEGLTRRYFVLLRPDAPPHAIAHRIELAYWDEWNHELESYVGWRELEEVLARLLAGCGTVAMEVSERDGVPILDTVPAGVVELVESLGVEVRSSADLISGTLAQWGERGRELHRKAAGILVETARRAYEMAAEAVSLTPRPWTAASAGSPGGGSGPRAETRRSLSTEYDLAAWIRETLEARGLTDLDTIVAVGPNAALPHYEPSARKSAPLRAGEVLLIDLWGRVAGEPDAIVADQTWMGFLGPELPAEVQRAWEAVRAARDGAVELVRARFRDGVTGAEVDRHVRSILQGHGYGEYILHRTGHGIDRHTHGVGPNLDSVESRDERRLVPGIGFSVEPGLYVEGSFGLRSEINVHLRPDGPEVSPDVTQELPWCAG